MKEASQLTEYTYDMIKFYYKKGLVPNVKQEKKLLGLWFSDYWLDKKSALSEILWICISKIQEYLEIYK